MAKTIGVILSLADKCSPALKTVAQAFGKTEKEANESIAKMRRANKLFVGSCVAIGGAVAGAVTGIITQTKKVSEFGDHIDKASQKIGMSKKAYQEWDFIMSQNGGNVDNLTGAYRTLRTNIDAFAKGAKNQVPILKQLGVSIRDNNGNLRSQEDIFNDSVQALQGVTNETQRAMLAQKLFGRGYQELAPLLSKGSGSLADLRAEYSKLGLGMSDEDIKRAVEMTDTMDKLGRVYNLVGMQLGVTLLPYVQEFTNKIIANLPAIKSGMIPVLQTLGNLLGFTVTHIRGVISTLTGLTVGLGVARVAVNLFGLSMKTAMVSTGIGAIVILVAELALHWKEVCEWVGRAWTKTKEFLHINQNASDNATTKNVVNKKHALGTKYSTGGVALVGEYGPELVNLPSGSSVVNNNDTNKILNNSNSNITVNLNVNGNLIGKREFFDEMMKMMAIDIRKALA
jgi:hypothetical protein